MKYNPKNSIISINQSKINKSFDNHNKYFTFFRHILDSIGKIDIQNNKICTCQSYNRNNNAFNNDNDSQQQVYPHMRKVYNDDTDLLEHVYIIMSTIKPECLINEQQDETIAQRRRRRARVSKQRAKALITEYCTRKIVDNIKLPTNKRNYSSLCFFLYLIEYADIKRILIFGLIQKLFYQKKNQIFF